MPFFSTNAYLTDASRFWIWIVLTVPSTALAFAFYLFRRWRDEARNRKAKLFDSEIELSKLIHSAANGAA